MESENKNAVTRFLLIFLSLLLFAVIAVQCLYSFGIIDVKHKNEEDTDDQIIYDAISRSGYELEQVIILSRHNIRSPMSGKDSLLGTVTPHEWFEWSSNPSELSLRGGVLETEMGQYFRKWMEAEGLFPENYHPEDEEVRFYSNSKQRTIATAQFFSSGLLPTANAEIEYRVEYDKMDPVFTPQLTFVSPEYNDDAAEQMKTLYDSYTVDLAEDYELLCEVIDFEDSAAYSDGSVPVLSMDDLSIVLSEYAEPGMTGSLKTACSISDALVLQYYEESDPEKAGFGHKLSNEQWTSISEIKDIYEDVLFSAPLIASNVAHPLLEEIRSELLCEERKFSFLCGHDSNIASVLAAIGAELYELPGAIEKRTPIGCKLVFCRWSDSKGDTFYSINLVYQTVDQMRNQTLLDISTQPACCHIALKDIDRNADWLYEEEEFLDLIDDAVIEYDRIIEAYGIQMENAA